MVSNGGDVSYHIRLLQDGDDTALACTHELSDQLHRSNPTKITQKRRRMRMREVMTDKKDKIWEDTYTL
jgi:hypothetical protein